MSTLNLASFDYISFVAITQIKRISNQESGMIRQYDIQNFINQERGCAGQNIPFQLLLTSNISDVQI